MQIYLKGCVFMAYDTLIREAKDLSEDMIEQAIEFIRYLKYASEKKQMQHFTGSEHTIHRSVNPLANELIAIADDFDGVRLWREG